MQDVGLHLQQGLYSFQSFEHGKKQLFYLIEFPSVVLVFVLNSVFFLQAFQLLDD